MGHMACTELHCLYKGALYLYLLLPGGKGHESDTCWHLMHLGFDSWQGQEIFSSQKCPDQLWDPISLLFNWYKGLFSWRGKLAGA